MVALAINNPIVVQWKGLSLDERKAAVLRAYQDRRQANISISLLSFKSGMRSAVIKGIEQDNQQLINLYGDIYLYAIKGIINS